MPIPACFAASRQVLPLYGVAHHLRSRAMRALRAPACSAASRAGKLSSDKISGLKQGTYFSPAPYSALSPLRKRLTIHPAEELSGYLMYFKAMELKPVQ